MDCTAGLLVDPTSGFAAGAGEQPAARPLFFFAPPPSVYLQYRGNGSKDWRGAEATVSSCSGEGFCLVDYLPGANRPRVESDSSLVTTTTLRA